VKESYGWSMPYKEVPKDEGSIMLKMNFMTSKGAPQAVDNPMIST